MDHRKTGPNRTKGTSYVLILIYLLYIFIKIWAQGGFWKKFMEITKKSSHIGLCLLGHSPAQLCSKKLYFRPRPSTHAGFFCKFLLSFFRRGYFWILWTIFWGIKMTVFGFYKSVGGGGLLRFRWQFLDIVRRISFLFLDVSKNYSKW